jgi:allantoate deiminase
MKYRKDPMVAASQIISQIPAIVKQKGDDTTVATVGSISCKPNNINVIPQSVKFTIDLRGMNPSTLDLVREEITVQLKEIEEQGFAYTINLLTQAKEVNLSKKILNIIEKVAKQKNISYKRMHSGANHDSSIMAQMTEVAMIFVPSVDGRSHCPEEYTKEEDIKAGCDVLLGTICELACG